MKCQNESEDVFFFIIWLKKFQPNHISSYYVYINYYVYHYIHAVQPLYDMLRLSLLNGNLGTEVFRQTCAKPVLFPHLMRRVQ